MDSLTFLARHRIAAWRVVGAALATMFLLGTPQWESHWVSAALRLLGILLVSAAAVGRLWCALYISGRKDSALVMDGPYSICRHPLYLFNLAGFLGVGALTESLAALALLAGSFALLYPQVIAAEDRLLAARFPGFDAYRRATPALWPDARRFRTPPRWEVDVRAFTRSAVDSIWFPLAAFVVEAVDLAHQRGWLEGIFRLY